MITHTDNGTPLMGITGYKNSGKTTLLTRLVEHFHNDGLTISTLKHAHHQAQIDQAGTDSMAHREAGAHQVLLVSPHRLALMEEFTDTEPPFSAVVEKLAPCALVLIEGYKRENFPKILIVGDDTPEIAHPGSVVGHIVDRSPDPGANPPQFHRDDIAGLALFIQKYCGLSPSSADGRQNGS
jgi:molybdopterin-guanine dinucleotide biosynthesis protein B